MPRLHVLSGDPLNPLTPPGWRLEGVGKILCLMYDLAVVELHHADRAYCPSLIDDRIFRDPELSLPRIRLTVKSDGLPG